MPNQISTSNTSAKGIILIILGILIFAWAKSYSPHIDFGEMIINFDSYFIKETFNTIIFIICVLLVYHGLKTLLKKGITNSPLEARGDVINQKKYEIDQKQKIALTASTKNKFTKQDLRNYGFGWIKNDWDRMIAIEDKDLQLLGQGILKNDSNRIYAIKDKDLQLLGLGILKNDSNRIYAIKDKDLQLLGLGILKNDSNRIGAII
ncbi:MAG: hypothetical protein IPK88_02335 [Saprospiraceae bacterium]|nr:hypothetical protein [Candidatus Defluviibacterium haderslevense]